MIDFGCSFSVIFKDALEKILEKRRQELEENDVRITTADGSLLLDYGKIHLPVQVGMKMYQHPFIVAKLTNEGILGTDFLRKYEGSIDFARNKICLEGADMATHSGLASDGYYWFSFVEEVVIPAGWWFQGRYWQGSFQEGVGWWIL